MASGSKRGEKRLSVVQINAWLKDTSQAVGAKLSDGGSLWLVRQRSGNGAWQCRYTLGGIRRDYSLGPWPTVTLEAARRERDRVRQQVAAGQDPFVERQLAKVARVDANQRTFEAVAEEWLTRKRREWSVIHAKKSEMALRRDVLPKLGRLPIDRIETVQVSAVIDAIQKRGDGRRETAQKIFQHVRSVFDFAQAKGWRADNPAGPVASIIAPAPPVNRHPALLRFDELGAVLRAAEVASISPAVRLAHRLVAFTAVRISNAVAARWEHVELDNDPPVWSIPRAEMKVTKGRSEPHRVILPRQIVEDLRRWRAVQGGAGIYVFPGARGGAHLSRESVEKALRVTLNLDGKHSPHGWRSAFSTRAREDTDFDGELVNLALDHVHASDVARSYDRGQRLAKRVALADWWGESLSKAERGGDVVPIRCVA